MAADSYQIEDVPEGSFGEKNQSGTSAISVKWPELMVPKCYLCGAGLVPFMVLYCCFYESFMSLLWVFFRKVQYVFFVTY
jgi:hypothetical protein